MKKVYSIFVLCGLLAVFFWFTSSPEDSSTSTDVPYQGTEHAHAPETTPGEGSEDDHSRQVQPSDPQSLSDSSSPSQNQVRSVATSKQRTEGAGEVNAPEDATSGTEKATDIVVPPHLVDRFTPEEYAAWKAKRQAAFGGPPLQRTLKDIPESMFRTQLEELSEEGRAKALATFNNKRIPMADVPSLRINNEAGVLYYECSFDCGHEHPGSPAKANMDRLGGDAAEGVPVAAEGEPVPSGAPVPVTTPPVYDSKPGAPFTLYLDFNGGSVSGKAWNNYRGDTSWTLDAWSDDGDRSTFNDTEQTAIFRVWQRVAEDYAPFDINVTTDASYDSVVQAGNDNTVGWVMISNHEADVSVYNDVLEQYEDGTDGELDAVDNTGKPLPSPGAGGVAYRGAADLSSFASTYQPAWVHAGNLAGGAATYEDFFAAAASHEFGHNLDLSHDGESGSGGDGAYYDGHGSGLASWGPIMGSGYYSDTTQWSKGEYANATNTEDDLVIIETTLLANSSGSIGFSNDDHGNTTGAATVLDLTGATITVPATTYIAGDEVGANEGIIETNTDLDFWSFTTGSGSITITATPYTAPARKKGHNLDIKLVLYDSGGAILATSEPDNELAATISYSAPSSGTYYISIEGDGWGDPLGGPTGWTDYGSIGQYFLSGSVAIPNDPPTDIALAGSTVAENEPSGTAVGTLSSTDPDSGDTAAYSLVSGTGDADNAEFQISGTQLQTAGPLDYEAGSTRSVRIRVTDSQGASYEEAFTITVTDADDAPAIALVWPDTDTVGIPTGVGLVLDSTVTDDGFGGSSLTLTWSKVSGLGSVSWDNQNQADTAVTFSADGDYVLRLTAFDGTNTTTQDFTVTVGATGGGALPGPPTPDLHYAFDESSGTSAADSAGSNNGSVSGTASWVAGQRGGAIEFDTNVEYVQSASAVALTVGSTWSASGWFRLETAPASTGTRKFLQQNNGAEGAGRTWFGVLDDSGTYRLTSYVGGKEATTGGQVALGEWYHAAIVADGIDVALYLDGVEVARTTQVIEANSAEFRIGNHKDGSEGADNQWFGAVDDLALYNRELTAQEIATLAGLADTTAGPTDSLVGRWQLNDASGSTATDDSGNANNGTLNGPVWTVGRWGGALDFDGSNDYVDLGDVDAIDGATALSISMWARMDNNTADHTLLSKSNFAGSSNSFLLWRDEAAFISGRSDTITMAIGDSSSSDIRIEGAAGSLGDTGWHHIVVTFQAGSASGLRLYIDGVEDANSPVDVSSISALPVSSSPLRLGTSADTFAGKWLNGNLDEVRIYNRVLTPSEVTALGEAAPTNTGPAVEAGGPYNGLISETVSLDGTVSDGEGDSTTTAWSQVSGPVSASFGNTAVVDTTVSSATDGDYVLRLTANDGAVKTFDDADFTVASPSGPGELYFESASYSVDEDGTSVTIDVRRGGGIDGEVSVTYNTANGSATAGSDYTAVTGGTLTWADQENGLKSFSVTITDDSSNEGDETFTVSLSGPTNSATLGSPSTTTVTIVENDLPPVAASGLNATASDRYQIDLSWTDNSSTETGFKIERKTGAGSYSLIHTTAANATSYNDTPVSDNTSYTYRVRATNAFGDSAWTSEASATTPATANGTLALSSATYSGLENGGSITITVTRTGGTDDAVSVGYATTNGTATAGSDYTATSGTLNWSDEDGVNKTFTVNLTPDTTYEGDETFTVALSGVTGGASLGTGTATVTITEDDPIPAGARVTAQSPVTGSEQAPGLTQLTLTFSESMEPTSFMVADDVVSFTGGQGTDVSANITGHSWANNDTELTITFNALNIEANYRLVVGPEILNLASWPMDQDQDGNLGEPEEDTYAANLWVATAGSGLVFWSDLVGTDALDAGWTLGAGWATGNAGEDGTIGPDAGADGNPIVGTNLSGDYAQGIDSYLTSPVIDCSGYTGVTLSFQRWLETAKGDSASIEVNNGSGWQTIQTIPENTSDGNWTASSFNVSAHADGNASFQIRWGVVEGGQPNQASGWQIDQIEITGNGGTTPPPAPVVVGHSPSGTVSGNVSSLYLSFSQPMDETTFSLSDIGSFTDPVAADITPSGSAWVSSTLLRIDFSDQSDAGDYTLVLNPSLTDDWASALNQDTDGTAGESGQDAYTATFTIASGTPPAAPSGLSASASSSTQIDLSWMDNSSNETGFKVQRRTSSTGFTTIATPAPDATSYNDSGLSAGTEYFYQVIATNGSGDSTPTSEASATTPKAAATVTLSDLTQTYDGSAKSITVTTVPADLTVNVTYDDSGTAPTAAGSYDVVATVIHAQYQGNASDTLVIQKAVPVITTAPTASQISFGQSLADSTLSEGAANVAGSFAFSTPATSPEVGTASQEVTFTPTDTANYTTATVNVDVTVTKAAATVTLSNLTQTYDGTAKPATVTTDPTGLTLNVTYDGVGTVPTAAGSYAVEATVVDAQYQGSDSKTLVISAAALEVTADDQSKTEGDTDPSLTSQITSGQLFGSDTLSGSLTREGGETSGTYAIQQGTLAAGSNYSLTFVSGTFTILTEAGILDSEGDNMDDDWESTHSQPGDPDSDGDLDPTADGDSDGATNYEEFMAGTDPNDGTKFLKLMGMTFDGQGQPVLEWTSVQDGTTPARTYTLQVSSDLTNPNSWSDVVSGVGPDGNTTSRTDENATPPSVRHYRVVPE